MPDHPPRISDAEWHVMQVIWDHHPMTAAEVHQHLADEHSWTQRTVKTLLARLVAKEALAFEVEGKRYRYRPLTSRQECVRAESRTFIDRVFQGSASPMLLEFVKGSDLSPEEIDELRRLLDEKAGES